MYLLLHIYVYSCITIITVATFNLPIILKNGEVRKNNYCSLANSFYGGKVSLLNALNGHTINVGIDSPRQNNPFYMNLTAKGYPVSGFM